MIDLKTHWIVEDFSPTPLMRQHIDAHFDEQGNRNRRGKKHAGGVRIFKSLRSTSSIIQVRQRFPGSDVNGRALCYVRRNPVSV